MMDDIKTSSATWKCDKCGYETTFLIAEDGSSRPLPDNLGICGIANPTGICRGIQKLTKGS